MNSSIVIVSIAVFLLIIVALYLFWRVRFGPPVDGFPSVLAYHKVTSFEFGGTWVTAGGFERQIDFLLNSGYRFISEVEFLKALEGKRPSSSRELLLTFDDGYRELTRNAVPILKSRDIPALIFLVTSFMGKKNLWELGLPGRSFVHLDWGEAKELLDEGFSMGSHSCRHLDLTRLSLDEAREEIVSSRKEIEDRLGTEVLSFSYPYGRANAAVRKIVEESGYRAAFTMYPSFKNSRLERFELRRNGVYIIDFPLSVREKLSGRPLYWFEDLKGRAINAFAVITPLLKKGESGDIG